MSDITPIGRPALPALGGPTRTIQSAGVNGVPSRPGDQVELSAGARFLSRLHELPDVRQELVERVKQEIAAGNYDSEEKIAAALDNMLEDLKS